MTTLDLFTFENVIYSSIGCAIFYGKFGRTELRAYVLSDFFDMFEVYDDGFKNIRPGIELIVFVVLGCIVGIGLTAPTSPTQALAAGLGWTGLFTSSNAKITV